MKAENKLLGFLPGMSLDFLYFHFFFSCMLRCSALWSNTVFPLCWPPSVGNSSECPPPGNAPDDTVCVDMGKCKDGECVPFCEREKNLRSCACNGGWHRTELKCVLRGTVSGFWKSLKVVFSGLVFSLWKKNGNVLLSSDGLGLKTFRWDLES